MTWDYIGNRWAIDLLRSQIAADAVRHAYLFAGPSAVGKRTLALRFAQALMCDQAIQPGSMCEQDECRACRLTPMGKHPDLHLVTVEAGRSTIGVVQIRELQRSLALAPYEASRRIALLPEFQHASDAAANALLKTLEEPPRPVILLLTSPRVESLLPTIVSRCEVLNLRALPSDQLAEALRARGMQGNRADLLAGLSGGRPGQALALAADPTALERRERWLGDLLNVLAQDRRGRFAYVHQSLQGKDLEAQRQESLGALETWIGLWRDAMLLAVEAHGRVGNPDRREELRWLVGALSAQRIATGLRLTQHTIDALSSFVNPRLALETLMLDLPRVPARSNVASS